ncbi:extracellular solute-binding protein [Providencia stuartii]|uniref:extracellular solute-binding protein n=1 Tax=Providencia stuartii TaxID=588 RepID=UPI0014954227|nr:extracellular solute-binding protein [Providencia stuartii]NPD41886.1 extracellular solute-binding protein [Providencia stuartii]NPD93468.1 extracellular solute-binding protein [Providencia stuartii]
MKKISLALLLGVTVISTSYAQDVDKNSFPNWDEVIKQAKQEGEVTFNIWYLQPQWRNFVKGFEDEYGIKVQISEGTIDGNMNKLLAESKKQSGKIDVMALSIAQLPITLKANAISKVDWLPGYKNGVHTIQNIDTQGYAVAFWGNQTGFAYDPKQFGDQALPQTLNDLQAFIDANPNRFGYNDPNNGGAGEAFIQRIVTLKSGEFDSSATKIDPKVIKGWSSGWAWFTKNKSSITQTASGADSLTRLNDGELMLVPAWEDHMLGLQHNGAITSRLKFYVPKFGMPGGGNVVTIAANSQHPNASAVFINWLIQPKTQQALKETFGTSPMTKMATANQVSDVKFYGKDYSMLFRKEFVRNVTMK